MDGGIRQGIVTLMRWASSSRRRHARRRHGDDVRGDVNVLDGVRRGGGGRGRGRGIHGGGIIQRRVAKLTAKEATKILNDSVLRRLHAPQVDEPTLLCHAHER